ncbi:hypothetical protein CF065_07815 [Clostridium sporogenes]
MFGWIKSSWNNMKGKFKKIADKVRTRKITIQIEEGVRGVNNATKNIFGRGTKTITNAYKKPHKWVNNSWRNIKKAHHTIVRYTSPRAMVNPKRYASQERMNEDIGTRILKYLQDKIVFISALTLTTAMVMSEIIDNYDISFSNDGIWVFSPGKGFQYAIKIGGDSMDGRGKAKNLYKFASKGNGNATNNIVKGFDTTLNAGKQGKHIIGHNNYIKGKSIVKGTMDEIQKLVNDFAGKGE